MDGLGSFLDRWDQGLEDPIRVRSILNSFKPLLNLIKVSRLYWLDYLGGGVNSTLGEVTNLALTS